MAYDQYIQGRLSDRSRNYAHRAIRDLALAAACEEKVEDGSHSEYQIWFLVRALCNEYNDNYEARVEFARERVRHMAALDTELAVKFGK